jgi:hypothetical protein
MSSSQGVSVRFQNAMSRDSTSPVARIASASPPPAPASPSSSVVSTSAPIPNA